MYCRQCGNEKTKVHGCYDEFTGESLFVYRCLKCQKEDNKIAMAVLSIIILVFIGIICFVFFMSPK